MGHMTTRTITRTIAAGFVVALLATACGGGTTVADTTGDAAAEAAGTPTAVETPTEVLATVTPEAAATMTIGEVLRTDERFTMWRSVAERTMTPIAPSWLDVWDWEAERMGDERDGVTVFAPTDAAFAKLDPAVLAVLEDPDVENDLLYGLLGHHYVHRRYPSADFEAGPQRTWRRSVSGPVELTLDPLTWGGQPILQTDLEVANGYLHVLDGVVVPDDLAAAATGG